ncbi:conserved hypothetical protein [gamma proteobacterium HTCC5015]|nr:conserved hypothetical protein [gamma proteobacterium HTCC5015]
MRHSRELSKLYREGIAECQNIAECGWRGRVSVAYEAEITPSAQPNPEISLPLSDYIRKRSQGGIEHKAEEQLELSIDGASQ